MRAASLSLRARLTLGLSALAALLLALASLSLLSLSRLGSAVGTILQENYVSVVACADMNEALERLDSAALFAASGQLEAARPMLASHRQAFERALAREADNITLPDEGPLVRELDARYRAYVADVDRVLARADGRDTGPYFRELLPRFYELKSLIRHISELNQAHMEGADRATRQLARKSMQASIAASALTLMLAGALALWLPRAIVAPLASLRRAALRIGEGELGEPVPHPGVTELVPVADAFNAMQAKLRAYRDSSLGELLAAKDLARTTVACMVDPVVVVRKGGDVLLVNEAAERAFGVAEGSADELRAQERALPEPILLSAEQTLSSGHPVAPSSLSDAVHHVGKDGERFYLVRAAPLATEGDDPPRALVVAQDVTRFRRIDELKSSVVATVSHEFKTPLTSLRMATHMLLEPRMGELTESQRELVTTARDDAERLRLLVDEFLDLTRIEAEAGALRRVPVDLARLLAQVADAHRALAQSKGVSLEVSPSADGRAVLDPDKITVALANLVSNALQHTSQGGSVRLDASSEGDSIKLTVGDSGEGIRSEDLPHIFERFRRGTGAEKDVRRLGLGLAITREIVQQHGGEVSVDSSPGRGARFTVRLPALLWPRALRSGRAC